VCFGAFHAFSGRPLSRASRPFIGRISKGSSGSRARAPWSFWAPIVRLSRAKLLMKACGWSVSDACAWKPGIVLVDSRSRLIANRSLWSENWSSAYPLSSPAFLGTSPALCLVLGSELNEAGFALPGLDGLAGTPRRRPRRACAAPFKLYSTTGAVVAAAAALSACVPRRWRRRAASTASPTARISIEPSNSGSTKNGAPN